MVSIRQLQTLGEEFYQAYKDVSTLSLIIKVPELRNGFMIRGCRN